MSSAADIWKDNELDPTDSTNPVYTFGTNIRAVYVMLCVITRGDVGCRLSG
jgi:hypothetical protein